MGMQMERATSAEGRCSFYEGSRASCLLYMRGMTSEEACHDCLRHFPAHKKSWPVRVWRCGRDLCQLTSLIGCRRVLAELWLGSRQRVSHSRVFQITHRGLAVPVNFFMRCLKFSFTSSFLSSIFSSLQPPLWHGSYTFTRHRFHAAPCSCRFCCGPSLTTTAPMVTTLHDSSRAAVNMLNQALIASEPFHNLALGGSKHASARSGIVLPSLFVLLIDLVPLDFSTFCPNLLQSSLFLCLDARAMVGT